MLSLVFNDKSLEKFKINFNPYTMKFGQDVQDTQPLTTVQAKIHSKSPKVLKIMLGDACNFRCKYCRQDHHGRKDSFNPARLAAFMQMLTDNLSLHQLERVEYWGGEPLLYWDEIRYLMDRIETHVKRPVTHHITTNGSLLTNDIVSDIKSLKYLFKLSHDGPGQSLRTADPLKLHESKIMDLYTHMKTAEGSKFHINSVLTKLCPSPLTIVNFFRKTFDNDISIMKIEPVIPYNDDALSYAINPADMSKFSFQIANDIIRGDIVRSVVEYQQLWDAFVLMEAAPDYIYNMTEAKCHGSQLMTICTDLDGNLTPCQVYDNYTPDQVIGHLTKLDDIKEELPFAPINRSGRCTNCPVISLCRGVCPHIAPGQHADTNCLMRYHTYLGILTAFLFFKTQKFLIQVNGDYYHNQQR